VDSLTAYAPGSASNLGPGFDCLGVAFTGKGDRVTASRTEGHGVRVTSVSDSRVPTDPERNTAAIAAAAVLRMADADVGITLAVEKGLPLSGGLGGSAASAVAGALAADALIGAGLRKLDLLGAALEAEGVVSGRHADNVAPSLLGGAVLVYGVDPIELAAVRIHPSLVFVLATPSYRVETAKARAVLPRQVPRGDAVAQAGHLAALVLGLERGDRDLVGPAMADRIAEPARAALYPGYAEAKAAALEAGAFGVAVSGAGPTVLAVANREVRASVARALGEAYRRAGFAVECHEAEVDAAGARLVS
jgi:homoserine kinase